MNTDEEGMKDVTERVIGCAFRVANALGSGFLEKVYENALAHEVRKAGLIVSQQYAITVQYDGVVVGDYAADLLVEKYLLVELKCVRAFNDIHSAQCLNYLRATGFHLCLLLNFASPRLEIKRIVR
jgi:GxxExxY protein